MTAEQRRRQEQEEEEDLPSRIQALQDYFDSVHEYIDGGRSPRDLRMEAMIPYVQGEKPVLMRVRTAATIRAAVDFAVRNDLQVILAGAAEAWLETDLLVREGIPVLIPPAGRSTLGANTPTQSY
ncbi:MAG: hypothetical protein IIC73_06070, partial [Armatimonadetes bacterium]|nr:hypothetical protein [Armatimonadota bacterium]